MLRFHPLRASEHLPTPSTGRGLGQQLSMSVHVKPLTLTLGQHKMVERLARRVAREQHSRGAGARHEQSLVIGRSKSMPVKVGVGHELSKQAGHRKGGPIIELPQRAPVEL